MLCEINSYDVHSHTFFRKNGVSEFHLKTSSANFWAFVQLFKPFMAIYKFSSAKKVNQLHRMFSEMAHPIPEIPIVSSSQRGDT